MIVVMAVEQLAVMECLDEFHSSHLWHVQITKEQFGNILLNEFKSFGAIAGGADIFWRIAANAEAAREYRANDR